MRRLYERLDLVARAERTTLICGETGSGKELVATALHHRSRRRAKPLLAVNCAALPDSLADSELFGHTNGAFTGAAGSRGGLARASDGGTLFLDEVDALNLPVQARLLRFLETGEYRAVGSDQTSYADVWVLAATNKSLQELVARGAFRLDLLYRLQVLRVDVPPLGARGEDVELLAQHFLRDLGRDDLTLTPRALAALHAHSWPGNVRELRNRIEQAVVLCRGSSIDVDDLGLAPEPTAGACEVTASQPADLMEHLWQLVEARGLSLGEAVELCERMIIEAALKSADENRTRAAQRLGIHVRTIFKKLNRFGRE